MMLKCRVATGSPYPNFCATQNCKWRTAASQRVRGFQSRSGLPRIHRTIHGVTVEDLDGHDLAYQSGPHYFFYKWLITIKGLLKSVACFSHGHVTQSDLPRASLNGVQELRHSLWPYPRQSLFPHSEDFSGVPALRKQKFQSSLSALTLFS